MCPCIASVIVNDDQQDATILAYLFIPNQLYMFRAMSSPIIRCTWLYLQLWHCPPILLPAGVLDEMELAVPSHTWHQPAAISVDNIRSCKYSQVLLMMGEDIAGNMYSWLGMHKLAKIVASCWSSFKIVVEIFTRLHFYWIIWKKTPRFIFLEIILEIRINVSKIASLIALLQNL